MSRDLQWRRIVLESLAVVASILLAFAIDAWWDDAVARGDERESLLVVSADLQASVRELNDYAGYVTEISEASLRAYRALTTTVPDAARDSVSDLLVTSTLRRTMSLPRTGYTDLVSGGGLRLIEDRELRNEIVRFYELVDRLELVAEKNSAIHTDGHLADALIRSGLMLKRPIRSTEDDASGSDASIRAILGPGFQHPSDPLWRFAPDSREWERVRAALLQNGRGTQTNVAIARRLEVAATELDHLIASHLADGTL